MGLEVRRYKHGYAVFEGGGRKSQAYATKFEAEGRMEREEARRRAKKKRRCLTCSNEIESEGPHHRMCDYCRRYGASLPNQMAG